MTGDDEGGTVKFNRRCLLLGRRLKLYLIDSLIANYLVKLSPFGVAYRPLQQAGLRVIGEPRFF